MRVVISRVAIGLLSFLVLSVAASCENPLLPPQATVNSVRMRGDVGWRSQGWQGRPGVEWSVYVANRGSDASQFYFSGCAVRVRLYGSRELVGVPIWENFRDGDICPLFLATLTIPPGSEVTHIKLDGWAPLRRPDSPDPRLVSGQVLHAVRSRMTETTGRGASMGEVWSFPERRARVEAGCSISPRPSLSSTTLCVAPRFQPVPAGMVQRSSLDSGGWGYEKEPLCGSDTRGRRGQVSRSGFSELLVVARRSSGQ